MPVYQPPERRIVVRIVYDGPAMAGKTTNLQSLCALLPLQKRPELYTPGALRGRTMFFDWLEMPTGRVGGHELICQVLSVPGQTKRSYRRRPLIATADVVVYVADSAPEAGEENLASWGLLRRYLRDRRPDSIPVIVQANKQDVDGAHDIDGIAEQLCLSPEINVLPAKAHVGAGVRETFKAAVRAAMLRVQGLMALGMLDHGRAQTADELFDAMLDAEVSSPE